MLLWFLILAAAIGTSLMSWAGDSRKSVMITIVAGLMIALLGLTTAFLSGDKFDTVRAGIISMALIAINYPRRKIWNKAEL